MLPLPAHLHYLTEEALDFFIARALEEDLGSGDHSSLASIPKGKAASAVLKIKGDGVIAGLAVADRIFRKVDARLAIDWHTKDGDAVCFGETAFTVSGPASSIPSAERLVLNCMQRMSGIATYTASLKKLIAHTRCQLLDTRKTTPNFRICEKWAVAIGGGTNHRFGLYDMVMLKDNHVDYAGGVEAAIDATRTYLQQNQLELKIEIETRNLNEVRRVLSHGGVDRIMLDNFAIPQLSEAVGLINRKVETEASGGITEETIALVAETGVDFISVGALTHSVKSLDLSLKAI